MANEYVKNCSTSLVIMKMQFELACTEHLNLIGMMTI